MKRLLISLFLITAVGLAAGCAYVEDYRRHGPMTGEFGDDMRRFESIHAGQNERWLKRRGTSIEQLTGMSTAEVRRMLGKPNSSYIPADSAYCRSHPDECFSDVGIEKWRYVIPHFFYLGGFHSITLTFYQDRLVSVSEKP